MRGRKREENKTDSPGKTGQPDEIQRAFWLYRRFWVGIVIILIAGRFLLPHIPLLRGWEQKFSAGATEIGKLETPIDAIKTSNPEEVISSFKAKFDIPQALIYLNGAQLLAAWKCSPLNEEGVCLRYAWNNEPITLILSYHPKRVRKTHGPFSRTGWGGYFIVQPKLAAALVGPADPSDLLDLWPYAIQFANATASKSEMIKMAQPRNLPNINLPATPNQIPQAPQGSQLVTAPKDAPKK